MEQKIDYVRQMLIFSCHANSSIQSGTISLSYTVLDNGANIIASNDFFVSQSQLNFKVEQ